MNFLKAGEYKGEIETKAEVEDCFVTSTRYASTSAPPMWHYHENIHICLVLQKGRAETRRSIRYVEKTGSVFFYPAGEWHRWTSSGPSARSLNVEIGPGFLQQYDLAAGEVKRAVETRVDLRSSLLRIQSEMAHDSFAECLPPLLLELCSPSCSRQELGRPIWAIQLQDYLTDNWNQELSLREMSKTVGVHPVTISRYFPRYFGCRLGDYRRKVKIERSIELIRHSPFSLSEIAHHCQFADQSHFIRTFKQTTGFLPGQFRRL